MTDEQDDVLDHLRAELGAVAPSSRFAASVRARVATESTRRRWSAGWVVPVGVAATIALAIAGYAAFRAVPPVTAPAAAPSANLAAVTRPPVVASGRQAEPPPAAARP